MLKYQPRITEQEPFLKGVPDTKLSLLLQHQELISKDLKDLPVAPTQWGWVLAGKNQQPFNLLFQLSHSLHHTEHPQSCWNPEDPCSRPEWLSLAPRFWPVLAA